MRLTPEVVPMLQLRNVQLTLLASLAFGALSAAFSAPLIAQTQQDVPTTIPDLSGYDGETRQSMELACISAKTRGPAAYGGCLNQQIALLQSSPGIPNLGGYDGETRQSMELACISAKTKGPAAYGACLNQQISSLKGSSGIPPLNGYDGETRQSMELACISAKTKGPAAYGACLNRQIASLQGSPATPKASGDDSETRQTTSPASSNGGTNSDTSKSGGTAVRPVNPMSRFTTENVMKVHHGMSSNKILELFGAPKNVNQSVCGASVGKPWTCTTWEYGEIPYEWATFTFAGDGGSLTLNNFDVHRQ